MAKRAGMWGLCAAIGLVLMAEGVVGTADPERFFYAVGEEAPTQSATAKAVSHKAETTKEACMRRFRWNKMKGQKRVCMEVNSSTQ